MGGERVKIISQENVTLKKSFPSLFGLFYQNMIISE